MNYSLKIAGAAIPLQRIASRTGLLLAGICALFTAACNLGKADLKTPEEADFLITGTLDKSVYRPGQAMVATVTVTNNSGHDIAAPELDGASMTFHYMLEDTNETISYPPVVSDQEEQQLGSRIKQLVPGESMKREFMLTQFTRHTGNMRAQAHYDPSPPYDSKKREKVFSNPMTYTVTGRQLFDRDTDGLIHKQDAIRLAEEKVGGEISGSEAIAITDEKGFAQYWVNVSAREGGGEKIHSFFVDPYWGRVKFEAKPFPASMMKDRAANAPPAPPRPKP